jgi:hypothetical protein
MTVDDNSQSPPLTRTEPERPGTTQSTAQACPDHVERKFDVVFLFPTGTMLYVERCRVDARSAFWFHFIRSLQKTATASQRGFQRSQARAWMTRLEAEGFPIWTLEADANAAGLGLQWFNLRKKQ